MAKYETPAYTVMEKHGPIELRTYERFTIVKYTSREDPYANDGFQALFRYIQSDNQAGATINMTVPVFQEFKADSMTMAFVIPEKHLLATPTPNHPDLHIDYFEAGLYAAITFKGSQSIRNMRQHQTQLVIWLKAHDYEMTSDIIGAFYNPPFIPPFMRRNELLVRVSI